MASLTQQPLHPGDHPMGREINQRLSCSMGHKQKAEWTQNWGSCPSTSLGDSCLGGIWALGNACQA